MPLSVLVCGVDVQAAPVPLGPEKADATTSSFVIGIRRHSGEPYGYRYSTKNPAVGSVLVAVLPCQQRTSIT
jgi:hypothetical protein